MMDFENMTEEELMAYLASIGGYAPGSAINYLPAPGDKDSRDYQQDVNDQLTDVLKAGDMWFEDIIPGLPPEVEDPGEYTGFRPDEAAIWQNNQAVQAVIRLVNEEKVPYEEALSEVYRAEIPGVPTYLADSQFNTAGDYNAEAFRALTASALQDTAKYEREYGDWESQASQYDESIRPRSLLEDMGPADERQQKLTDADYEAFARQYNPDNTLKDPRAHTLSPLTQNVTINPNVVTKMDGAMSLGREALPTRAGPSRQGGRMAPPKPDGGGGIMPDGTKVRQNDAGRMVRQNDAKVSRKSTGTGKSGKASERGSKKSRTQRANKDNVKVNSFKQKKYINESNREDANSWNRRARSVKTESEADRRKRMLIQAITSMTGG